MENNRNIVIPVSTGMNTDKHPSELQQGEYIYALNSTIDGIYGDSIKSSNEPSNLLCSRFKSGFRVVGFKRDINSDLTYFFITNPQTGTSEIGYIKTLQTIEEETDLEYYCGCDIKSMLANPLEDQEQIESCNYTTLINDDCNKCLNFSIHHPILSIELKEEKGDKKLFFTDNYNPPRYINLNTIEDYKFYTTEDCETDAEIDCTEECPECGDCNTCIDCEKLKIHQDSTKPCLFDLSITSNGNLRRGRYELFFCYSDAIGRERSKYYRITNPIDIFDKSDNILDQTQLADETSNAIKIEIIDIDLSYEYYKIVSVQSTNVDGSIVGYEVGVYPVSTKIVHYTSEKNKQLISLNTIYQIKPKWDKVKGLVANDGQLYQYGLTARKDYNLQQIVILMSPFLKWQTGVAKENLYSFSENDSQYAQYMRNENYPFSIKFFSTDGYESLRFPLTFRPPTNEEIVEVDNNDVSSVLDSGNNCTEDRNKWWQYYNSAVIDTNSNCTQNLDDTVEIEVPSIQYCDKQLYNNTNTQNDTIQPPFDYTNLEDFLNQNYLEFINGGLYYNPSGTLTGIIETALADNTTCQPDTDCVVGDLQSEKIIFSNINDLGSVSNKKDLVDYEPSIYDGYLCDYIKRNTSYEYVEDTSMSAAVGTTVYLRKDSNDNCSLPISVPTAVSEGYHIESLTDSVLVNLLDVSKTISCTNANFQSNLHKNSIWFKADFNGEDKILIELSKITCNSEDLFYTNKTIRITTYDDCSDVNNVTCNIINLTSGVVLEFDKADFAADEFLISIEAPIVQDGVTSAYYLDLPCGCLALKYRDYEYASITLNWDSLIINKRQYYNVVCTYYLPIVDDCEVKPYQEGFFGYYESNRLYPNNKELYDAKDIKVSATSIPTKIKDLFENIFSDGINIDGDYILNENACIMSKNIRHYKFPDNNVAPFILNTTQAPLQETLIFPIGVKLDNEVINFFLDVAVINGLLTAEERSKIAKYEIFRGDRTLSKSIIAKGLLFDTYKYNESGRDVYYPNYPYNSLGKDALHYTNNSRNILIDHPFSSLKNNRYTFHSPDTHFYKPSTNSFTEICIDGYQYGSSLGKFDKVDGHPNHVILGKDAYKVATTLAATEAALELITKTGVATMTALETYRVGATVNPAGAFAATAFTIAVVAAAAVNTALLAGKYRYQWLETFKNSKKGFNYANKYSSFGFYNSLRDFHNTEGEMIRGIRSAKYLKSGNYNITENNTAGTTYLNNTDRESSLFLSFGNYYVNYKSNYINYDNYGGGNNPSRVTASDVNRCSNNDEFISNIASPYVTIRNFIADQYGDINDIRWINTGYCGVLSEDNSCKTIYGGDTRISRMSLKRKIPLFLTTAFEQADYTPFAYSLYNNIGSVKFYADFEIELSETVISDIIFPDLGSEFKLDCGTSSGTTITHNDNNTFYIPKTSKMYLYYYGIPQFLVESEINLNYRHARREPWEWFFPNGGTSDYSNWTQEKVVPIKYDNEYNYNNVYSTNILYDSTQIFPVNYRKRDWDKRADFINGVIASEIDRTESDDTEPWLIYKPFNIYEFPTSLGKLINLTSIESLRMLALFENQHMVFNPIDSLRERIDVYNRELGVGIFGQRPIQNIKSEIGYAGSQHNIVVSSEFGRFFTDAQRGQVMMLPLGEGGGIDIASYKRNGGYSGKRRWFKEQLPFKILKGGIQNLTPSDLDNAYNSVGITMVWDNKFSRLLLTKKDYIVKEDWVGKLQFIDGGFYKTTNNELVEVFVENISIFEDASFTIAYYPSTDSWVSFYSYKPNYYIPYNNYFQSGINNSNDSVENGLWSHLITNKSFQVFYGKKYTWIIETVAKTEAVNKVLHSYEYWLDARRYHNSYDFSEKYDVGFNKAYIYNKDSNSGLLNLVKTEENNYHQQVLYPKQNTNSIDVLVTPNQDKWYFNQFYDKVKNPLNNIPIWNYDNVWSNKTINRQAIDYFKTWNDRIRGDYFIVRLEQDIETRYNMIYRWGVIKSNILTS